MAHQDCVCSCLQYLLCAAQAVLAIAIIILAATKLSGGSFVDASIDPNTGQVSLERRHAQCFLGTEAASDGPCVLVFVLSGVSLAVSLAVSCVSRLCCCCLQHTCCWNLVDAAFAGAGVALWVAGAVTLTENAQAADAADVPRHYWRNDLLVLCWVQAGLFGLLLVIALSAFCSASCCPGSGSSKAGRRGAYERFRHDSESSYELAQRV
eukprot:scaffold1.g5633.t1